MGTEKITHIVGLGQAAELLTSYNKWRVNAACTKIIRSQLLNRIIMLLSVLLCFIETGVPTKYSIGALSFSVGPFKTYKEVDHSVQVFAEEAKRELTIVR